MTDGLVMNGARHTDGATQVVPPMTPDTPPEVTAPGVGATAGRTRGAGDLGLVRLAQGARARLAVDAARAA